MTFTEFNKLFRILYTEKQNRSEFIASIPRCICAAFFDNDYANSLEETLSTVLHTIFPSPILSDINYFLYEFEFGYEVHTEDKEYRITSLDDILIYFKEQYFAHDNSISS